MKVSTLITKSNLEKGLNLTVRYLIIMQLNLLEAGQSGKKGYFGKECMHEEINNWKEEQQMRMHGRHNNARVRVFAIHCNGWRARNV